MNEFEKRRIQQKVDNMTNIQRSVIPTYELEVNKPRNLKKEKLQLINEYSLNPLCLEHGKDPKFIKYKANFDSKEKFIQNNPDIMLINPDPFYVRPPPPNRRRKISISIAIIIIIICIIVVNVAR